MNELIKINNDTDRPTVMGRELHEALEVKEKYSDWFKRMCEYGFAEGEDFCVISGRNSFSENSEKPNKGGRPSADHQLTIGMAKEICMLQRTEIGSKIRKYFIEVENRYRTQQLPKMSQMEMIAGIANGCVELEKRTAQLEQKQAELEKKLTTDRDETIKATLEFGRIGALQRKQIAKAVKKRAIEICGYAETYDKFGKNVVNSIYKALQKKFNVPSYLDLEYRHYTDAMIFIQCFEPDPKLYIKIIHAQPGPKLGDLINMFSAE